ncbi:MAG TPA: hypothetical protein VFB12_30750 [Ktedonobacteraceae bacterium]|nr:hypothetical protein [Ktedonobacteraceae bacterium]
MTCTIKPPLGRLHPRAERGALVVASRQVEMATLQKSEVPSWTLAVDGL